MVRIDILEFLKNNWLIAIVLLIVVMLLVRAMFKLAMIALLVGGVLVFAFGYTPSEVLHLGKGAWNEAASMYEKTAKPVLEKELENAEYVIYPDGRFSIKTENVEVIGTKQSKTVIVRYKDKEMKVDVSVLGDAVKEQIERMQAQIPTE